MAKRYIIFRAEGQPLRGEQCTTAWPASIQSAVVLSGGLEEYFYNIMVMEGPDAVIDAWLEENEGKVTEVNHEEANTLGRQIVPPGTERVVEEGMGEEKVTKTYVATQFDVNNPDALWVEKTN